MLFNAPFRFRKVFPQDLTSPIVQRDLSMYTRIGTIVAVDAATGSCTIKWLDRPGVRYNVLITQASPGEWVIPPRGSVVLVSFDSNERARIIRYINMGQKVRVTQTNTLPNFQEGDRLWEGGNNSYLYMKANGDIVLSAGDQVFISLENATGTYKEEVVNLNLTTEAGTEYFGVLKRFVLGADGTNSIVSIMDPLNPLSLTTPLTEFRFKMVELANGALALQGISSPLVDIMFGTYTTDAGVITMANGLPAVAYPKELMMKMTTQSGISICIDKEGVVTVSGMKRLNYNNASVDVTDPDIAAGLAINNSALGTNGQHAAREQDPVTVPLGIVPNDPAHLTLISAAESNYKILQYLAQSFVNAGGPCTYNPASMPLSSSLQGVITSGAPNLYIGNS